MHLAAQAASPAGQAARSRDNGPRPLVANFHDLLKARALRLGSPLQILRRSI